MKGLPLTTTANLSWNLKQNQIDHEVVVFPLNLSDYSKVKINFIKCHSCLIFCGPPPPVVFSYKWFYSLP